MSAPEVIVWSLVVDSDYSVQTTLYGTEAEVYADLTSLAVHMDAPDDVTGDPGAVVDWLTENGVVLCIDEHAVALPSGTHA